MLSKLRVKRAGPHVAIRFRLSEPAAVRVTVKRGRRRIARLSAAAAAGANTLMLHKRLRRGRYRVTARATDLAGNAAPPVTRRFAGVRRAARSVAVTAHAPAYVCPLDHARRAKREASLA